MPLRRFSIDRTCNVESSAGHGRFAARPVRSVVCIGKYGTQRQWPKVHLEVGMEFSSFHTAKLWIMAYAKQEHFVVIKGRLRRGKEGKLKKKEHSNVIVPAGIKGRAQHLRRNNVAKGPKSATVNGMQMFQQKVQLYKLQPLSTNTIMNVIQQLTSLHVHGVSGKFCAWT